MIYSQNKEIEGLVNELYKFTSMDLRINLESFPDFIYLDTFNNDLLMQKISSFKPKFASEIRNIEYQVDFFKKLYSEGTISKVEDYNKLVKMSREFKNPGAYYNVDYNIIIIPKKYEDIGCIIGEEMFHFFNIYFNKKNENSIDQEFMGFIGRNVIKYFLNFHFNSDYEHLFKYHNIVKEDLIVSPKDKFEIDYNNHVKAYFKASNFMKKFNYNFNPIFFGIINNPKKFFNMSSDEIIKNF